MELEAVEAADVPVVFVAVAINVYETVLSRLVISQDPDAPVTVQFLLESPTTDTRYEAGVAPVPAATVIVAFNTPLTATGANGADGGARKLTPALLPSGVLTTTEALLAGGV